MNLNQYRHHITIEQQQLSYLDIGSGPTLLLAHPYLWDSQMWVPQIAILSQHYRCIVSDLWGHGNSAPMPKTCHSLKTLAEHHLALMDNLNIDQFSIIGSGIGGMWAAELCLLVPQRVNSLTLIGCFLGFEPEVSRAKYDKMLDSVRQQQAFPIELVDEIAPLFFAADITERKPELQAQFKQALAALPRDNIESIVRIGRMMFARRDIMEDATLLTLPCLIMVGTEDKPRPVLESYLMHDAIDGSEFIHIPQAGHMATLEQADFVNQQLMTFLSHRLG
ncbi:alpha/beta hydrolase [Shewanella sp. Isolate11]|uniref:alpha/beta fold hydrolase n=1 Tax=Shewanella sp. Isolate11 TaxID=2908530 RepID=UPI001EFD164E|nr:alpha/beta hydrolase [Shewanella sp. Isolate11]MCG9696771.1 alpha/beta hydrolase [Shewanella sp. Isolate11]